MIKGKWAKFLIFIGILGMVTIYVPNLLEITGYILPLYFLVVIASFFTPCLFMYSWTFTIFFVLFKFIGKGRFLIASLAVIVLSLAVPHYWNQKIYERIETLKKDDIAMELPLPIGGVLALEIPNSHSVNGPRNNKCQRLCQRLLYNKAYTQIIIKVSGKNDTYGFHLEKRPKCKSYNQISNGVAIKMANGECLIEVKNPINQADFTYKNERVGQEKHANYSLKLSAITVWADRITLIDNRTDEKEIIFQITNVAARTLAYPFIITTGTATWELRSEILRSEKVFNSAFKSDPKSIFGASAVKAIQGGLESKIKIIKNHLHSTNEISPETNRIIKSFWTDMSKKHSYNQEEITLIIDLIHDSTTKLPYNLFRIMNKMKPVSDDVIIALGNRVAHKGDFEASLAIGKLPDGKARVITPQLEQLAKSQELISLNSHAFSRLGDGSNLAVEQYINALKHYKTLLFQGEGHYTKQKAAVSGAIRGLCRLGERASSAKNILYSIFETRTIKASQSRQIAKTLIQIIGIKELKERYLNNNTYKGNDRVTNTVQHAIQRKETLAEKGLNPC